MCHTWLMSAWEYGELVSMWNNELFGWDFLWYGPDGNKEELPESGLPALNRLGAAGWELIDRSITVWRIANSNILLDQPALRETRYLLKREISPHVAAPPRRSH